MSVCRCPLPCAAAAAAGLLTASRLREHAASALAEISLPGRVEVLGTHPFLVVDGAHTPESSRELARALARMPASERVLLLSLTGEKSPLTVLQPLLRDATRVVLTRAEPLRSRDPQAVAAEIRTAFPALALDCVEDPEEALALAQRLTPADGLLCATGSMYVAGLARRLLRERQARRVAA